jgi:hypothetical protein
MVAANELVIEGGTGVKRNQGKQKLRPKAVRHTGRISPEVR